MNYAPGFDVCVDFCGRLPGPWPLHGVPQLLPHHGWAHRAVSSPS